MNNKCGKILTFIIVCIMGIALILPYLVTAFYGNLSGDDFNNTWIVLKQSSDNGFLKILSATKYFYMSWQGTYSGSLLTCIGLYLFHNRGTFGVHIEYAISILLYFFSFYYACNAVFKKTSNIKSRMIPLFVTIVFFFINLYDFEVGEVFYWHTGLCVYTVPLSLGLVAIGISISKNNNNVYCVLAAALAFISAGGALNISAFLCFFFLTYDLFLGIFKEKWRNVFCIFMFSFVGAVINVVAPGNYSRHSVISNDFPVFQSLVYSIIGVFQRHLELLFGITMPIILVVVVITVNYIDDSNHNFVNPFILAFVIFIGEAIIDFPVHLGYSNDYLPSRCVFVSKTAMMLMLYIWIINTVGWLLKKGMISRFTFSKQITILIVFLIYSAFLPFIQKNVTENYYPFIIYYDLASGKLEKYENDNNIIISALESANGEDVVVEIYGHVDIDYMHSLRLSEDPSYWVNVETVSYYRNAKSISVVYK